MGQGVARGHVGERCRREQDDPGQESRELEIEGHGCPVRLVTDHRTGGRTCSRETRQRSLRRMLEHPPISRRQGVPAEAAPHRVPAPAHGSRVGGSRQDLRQVAGRGTLDAQVSQDPVLAEDVLHHRVAVRDHGQAVGEGLQEYPAEAFAERGEHEAVGRRVVRRDLVIRH